jgi:release factor glutamine methyltransferase
MTIDAGQWLAQARARLSGQTQSPLSEAQALLGAVVGRSRAWVIAHPETELSPAQRARLDDLLARLLSGEPLPYLLGRWEFFGLEFSVSPAVLVPRPETELLVEQAMLWLNEHPGRRGAADVGTGSGSIAVALAYHVRDLTITASDASAQALEIAAANVAAYGLQARVRLAQTDLLDGLPGPFDLIVANLPYIPSCKLQGLEVARHEPLQALDGGPDGLSVIQRLLAALPGCLLPGGLALLEIEAGQGESAPLLARRALPRAQVSVLPDLAGLPRLVRIDHD